MNCCFIHVDTESSAETSLYTVNRKKAATITRPTACNFAKYNSTDYGNTGIFSSTFGVKR